MKGLPWAAVAVCLCCTLPARPAIAAVACLRCLPSRHSLHTSTAATLCARAWVCCQQRHPGVCRKGLVLVCARGAAAHLLSVRRCRLRALLSWDLSCAFVRVCICVLLELHPWAATPYMRGAVRSFRVSSRLKRVWRHTGQPLWGLIWEQGGYVGILVCIAHANLAVSVCGGGGGGSDSCCGDVLSDRLQGMLIFRR